MNQKRKEFAGWVRQKRKDVGLTLDKAAERIGYKSAASIKRIETGYEPVPAKRIIHFAAAYDIAVPRLLEKLRALEPRTAKEFDFLEKTFSAYFMQLYRSMEHGDHRKAGNRSSLHKQNYQDIEESERAYHHSNFQSVSGMLDNIFLLTELYIIRHRNALDTILSTARRLFAAISDITILGNFLPIFVRPLPCLVSPLSIRVEGLFLCS